MMTNREGRISEFNYYIACDQLLTRHGKSKRVGWWLDPGSLSAFGVPRVNEFFEGKIRINNVERGVKIVGEVRNSLGIHPGLAEWTDDPTWLDNELHLGIMVVGDDEVLSLTRGSASLWKAASKTYTLIRKKLRPEDYKKWDPIIKAVTDQFPVPITGHL